MNSFNYEYPVRQHFGKGCAESAIKEEMKNVGQRVLLAYGSGSLKCTGLYDKIRSWLEACGKQVTDFSGIMPNPTYAKVQEGVRLVREKRYRVHSRRGRRVGHRLLQDCVSTSTNGRGCVGRVVCASSSAC